MNKISLKLGNKNLKKNVSKKPKKKNSAQKTNLFDLDNAELTCLPHKSQSKIKIQTIDKFDFDEESSSKKKLIIKLKENVPNDNTPFEESVTEKEYSEVPIEEFGDALLRGMGWESDSEINGKKGKQQDRKKDISTISRIHPDGLGIGANLNEEINVEEGSFMPVVKIDKLTNAKIKDDKEKERESR